LDTSAIESTASAKQRTFSAKTANQRGHP
jgi:hypothetical protein